VGENEESFGLFGFALLGGVFGLFLLVFAGRFLGFADTIGFILTLTHDYPLLIKN